MTGLIQCPAALRSASVALAATLSVFCLQGCTGPSPDAQYTLGPDSQIQPGVPQGKVLEFSLKRSRTYPGFEHRWWLFIPAQYDGRKPLALMVFQDGTSYVAQDGSWRAAVVLNNLIAKNEIPLMAAVFVDAGQSAAGERYVKAADGSPLLNASWAINHRIIEYNTWSAAYSTFLLEEILPLVRRHVRITNDPEGRGIAGHSSGGVCAFTVAWHRPDQFRKVLSANAGFVNVRGENVYAELIRNTGKKPIRVWLLSGANDLVSPEWWGNLPEVNREVAAALDAKGYDYRFVFGQGTHSSAHAASLLPDALRWLWRDYPR